MPPRLLLRMINRSRQFARSYSISPSRSRAARGRTWARSPDSYRSSRILFDTSAKQYPQLLSPGSQAPFDHFDQHVTAYGLPACAVGG